MALAKLCLCWKHSEMTVCHSVVGGGHHALNHAEETAAGQLYEP